MRDILLKHMTQVLGWAEKRGMKVLEVTYNELFTEPAEHIRKIDELLDGTLDTEAMATTIDPTLYRNRR